MDIFRKRGFALENFCGLRWGMPRV